MTYILLCGYPSFSGACGQMYGWNEGGSCEECQQRLFDNIKVRTSKDRLRAAVNVKVSG